MPDRVNGQKTFGGTDMVNTLIGVMTSLSALIDPYDGAEDIITTNKHEQRVFGFLILNFFSKKIINLIYPRVKILKSKILKLL